MTRCLVVLCAVAGLTAASSARAQQMTADDPLAGFTDNAAFLRSPDNSIVLLPNGRLQVDYYAFTRPTPDMPVDTLLLRRARLELAGWIGPWFFFSLAGDFASAPPAGADPVAQSFIATTDDYVAIAPFGDNVILQAGQFDAPFTLENRTSDKYFDYMERSITVRTFGEPNNKEVGAMLHGLVADDLLFYSAGVFNGDGQNFKNVDADADFMGRGWVAPFSPLAIDAFKKITVGGSFWIGTRGAGGLALNSQATQGGFKFFDPKFTLADEKKTPAELHQYGNLKAWAFEVNVPIDHRVGMRVEYVRKTQDLLEEDITAASSGKVTKLGGASLEGYAFYGEVWAWILGDDRMIGDPGLQLPPRLKAFKSSRMKHGLMITARGDHLSEVISSDSPSLKDPSVGRTTITSPEVGVNYWYTKRFRGTFNYVANIIEGDAPAIPKVITKNGGHSTEHEFLFRLAIAL